jgi:hypothetical protein
MICWPNKMLFILLVQTNINGAILFYQFKVLKSPTFLNLRSNRAQLNYSHRLKIHHNIITDQYHK